MNCLRKFTLWKRSTRVILIISVPCMAHAGTECDQPNGAVGYVASIDREGNMHNEFEVIIGMCN